MKQCKEFVETRDGILPKSVKTCPNLSNWLFPHVARFGKELVREADEFLFGRLGQEILMWQREILRNDFIGGQPGTSVPFADSRIFLQINMLLFPILAKHLGTDKTMT